MVKLDLGKARERAKTPALSLKDTSPPDQNCVDESSIGSQTHPSQDPLGYCGIDILNGVEEYIDDIAQCMEKMDTGYNEELYRQLSRNCLAANQLKADDRSWETFIKSKFWDDMPQHRPAKEDRPKALRFTLLRTVTGYTRRGMQRASKIFRALNPLLISGIDPKNISDAIKSGGGIEALAVDNANIKKAQPNANTLRDRQVRQSKHPASCHRTVKWTGQKAEPMLEYPVSTRFRLTVEIGERSKQRPTLLVHEAEEVLGE